MEELRQSRKNVDYSTFVNIDGIAELEIEMQKILAALESGEGNIDEDETERKPVAIN